MRLLLLPIAPGDKSGYHKAVADDLRRLGSRADDVVVVHQPPGDIRLAGAREVLRPARRSPRRVLNLLQGRPMTDATAAELRAAVGSEGFDSIFVGDVTWYRAARDVFPGRRLTMRFHNFFSLPRSRAEFRSVSVDALFRMNMALFSRLEREICRDPLVDPIFITEVEEAFFKCHYPGRSTQVWSLDITQGPPPTRPTVPRVAYFGSVASHQRIGLERFLRDVLPQARDRVPALEVHLWGHGSEAFSDPSSGVVGHGYFRGSGMPHGGDALFMVPDVLGCGIKIKVGDLLRDGVPFIATPYAMDGYRYTAHQGVIVAELEDWPARIADYFNGTVKAGT